MILINRPMHINLYGNKNHVLVFALRFSNSPNKLSHMLKMSKKVPKRSAERHFALKIVPPHPSAGQLWAIFGSFSMAWRLRGAHDLPV
jgi:hypothetical protein